MIYRKLATYYDMFVDDELNNQYIDLIKHYHKNGSVLDLGTGTAVLAIELAKLGYHVTATDISNEMLENAYNNAIEEDVRINFFIHDILDTVNRDYDIITMTSDVINYLEDDTQMQKAFKNVSLAMNIESIFLFDFLRDTYLEKESGHQEEILLPDGVLKWDVRLTNIPNQIKHTVIIGNEKEIHIQRTYKPKEYTKMLKDNNLSVVKRVKLEDRFIFVCKKEI